MKRISFLCFGILLALSSCGLSPAAAPPADATGPVTLLSERSPNPRAFGDPKAPIVMREFSDYQ
jgi:hypothetical protein